MAHASISLSQPPANASFNVPNAIAFEAVSSRTGTQVREITLLTDGVAAGTVSGQLSGTWPNVPQGHHTLAVQAKYEDGTTDESLAIPVVVQPADVRLPPSAFFKIETIPSTDYRPILTPAMLELQVLATDPNPNGKITTATLFLNGEFFERKRNPGSVFLFGLKNYLTDTNATFTFQFQNNSGVLLTTNLDVPFQRAPFYARNAQIINVRAYLDSDGNAYSSGGEVIHRDGTRIQYRVEGKALNFTAVSRKGDAAGILFDSVAAGPTTAFRILNGNVDPLDSHSNCTPVAVSADATILLKQILPDGTPRALLWKGDAVTELIGFPPGALVVPGNMNDLGDIVGHYTDADNIVHPFLWRDGIAKDLVTPVAGVVIEPKFINNRGVVVGNIDSREFRWKDGVFEELPTAGYQDVQIFGLNNQGWLIGSGRNENEVIAILDRGDGWQTFNSIVAQWYGTGAKSTASGLNDSGCMYVYTSSGAFFVNPNSILPSFHLELGKFIPNGVSVLPNVRINGVNILNQRSANLVDWETWGTNILGFAMPGEDPQTMYRVVPQLQ